MERLWDEEKWSFHLTDPFTCHLRYLYLKIMRKKYEGLIVSTIWVEVNIEKKKKKLPNNNFIIIIVLPF